MKKILMILAAILALGSLTAKAQMRLDIGSNITHFYNQSKEQWEQQVLQMILSGGVIDLRKAEPVKCMDFEFLKNYPKNGSDPISRIVGFENLSLHRKGRDS